ncbi:c-type cytochrome [Psychrobacter urativorans]|uniref:c-type cytochrome n=1 Tax=Psychrobacter urativorans TaxID=45610 RepID=UPI001919D794|nr:cytochrome c [Psychrobacter urativorans]
MKRPKNKFTKDFGSAARNIDDDFKPTEPKNPVPWPFIAIAIALAISGGVTLYFDAQATEDGKDAQLVRAAEDKGVSSADANTAEIREAEGELLAAQGAALFGTYCATCHQANGSGVRNAIPPLDGSPYVVANAEVPTAILLRGITGLIEVKGETYDGRMPTFHATLENEEIALILTHIRSKWSNKADAVSSNQVAAVRKALESKIDYPWQGGFELHNAFDIEYTAVAENQAKAQMAVPDQAEEAQEETQ